jgi:hypothetical protein
MKILFNKPHSNVAVQDPALLIQNLYRGILVREPESGAVEHLTAQLNEGKDLNEVLNQFLTSEEFARQRKACSKLFVPPGHFYSPIVNIDEVRPIFETRIDKPEYLPGIEINTNAMLALWKQLVPYLRETEFPDEQTEGFRYYYKNGAFSYGDGSILSAMLRHFQPKRLVEVGSGYSSACAMDTIERYIKGKVEVIFVEPYPKLLLSLLGVDVAERVKIHECGIQFVDISTFKELESGDFLFIDSTHIMKTGSDVCHELFEVLPALQSGVFIHFHDIFWPFEYGASWVLQDNRSWNELYGLRAFLMYNTAFEVVFFNDYFVKQHRDAILCDFPTMLKNSGGSIWLRKK